MNTQKKSWAFLLTILCLGLILASCKLVTYLTQKEEEEFLQHSIYTVDYDTLLGDLQNGKLSALELFSDSNEYPSEDEGRDDLNWNWEDYYLIAQSIHQREWKESLDDWKIIGIHFRGECKNIGENNEYTRFEFFKEVEEEGLLVRYSSTVFIFPEMNIVEAYRRKFSPVLFPWGGVDEGDLTVWPDEALFIAEENGGDILHSDGDEKCYFLITLGKNWVVSYSDSDQQLKEFHINPKTGDLEKIE